MNKKDVIAPITIVNVSPSHEFDNPAPLDFVVEVAGLLTGAFCVAVTGPLEGGVVWGLLPDGVLL